MDDDDYYPPERISHAVSTLQKNPKALCAGSSTMYIYFKHIGNYTLVATFSGDANNNGSFSGDNQVTVQKQDQISSVIQFLDPATGSYSASFPTSWTTNKNLLVRAVLTGPSSNFSPGNTTFPPTALADRKVLVTLNPWGTDNCLVNTDAGSLVTTAGSGIYEVQITQKAIGSNVNPTLLQNVTAADFSIKCTQPDNLGLSFTITFSDKTSPKKDSDDFGFTGTPVGRFNISMALPSLGSMTVSIVRQDSSSTGMLTGNSIAQLHFGQKYTIGISSSSTYFIS